MNSKLSLLALCVIGVFYSPRAEAQSIIGEFAGGIAEAVGETIEQIEKELEQIENESVLAVNPIEQCKVQRTKEERAAVSDLLRHIQEEKPTLAQLACASVSIELNPNFAYAPDPAAEGGIAAIVTSYDIEGLEEYRNCVKTLDGTEFTKPLREILSFAPAGSLFLERLKEVKTNHAKCLMEIDENMSEELIVDEVLNFSLLSFFV